MALRILEFDTTKEMEFALQGGVRGGRRVINGQGRLHNLHDKTLILVSPAATITFSDPSGDGLTFEEVADQIIAVASTIAVSWRDGMLHLQLATPTAAVTVDKDGSANSIFGFSSAKDHAGLFINGPGGSTPRLVETCTKARLDGYYVVVEV